MLKTTEESTNFDTEEEEKLCFVNSEVNFVLANESLEFGTCEVFLHGYNQQRHDVE